VEVQAVRRLELLGEFCERGGASGSGGRSAVAALPSSAARHGAHGVAAQQQLAHQLAADEARAARDGGNLARARERGGHGVGAEKEERVGFF
jgi:hypothetical protein